jgi:SnoaL-like domain
MRVEDELAIRNLIHRVSAAQDKWMEKEEYLTNYTQDCEWQLEGDQVYKGHEDLADRLQFVLDIGMCGRGLPTRHCNTSLWIEPDPQDENRAVAHVHNFMITVEDGAPRLAGMADYTDTCQRGEDGVWRIARRYLTNVHSVTEKFDAGRDERRG